MRTIEEILASNLRARRKKFKLSMEKLAAEAGLSMPAIQMIETQKRWPNPDTLRKLAKALRLEVHQLFAPNEAEIKPLYDEIDLINTIAILTKKLQPIQEELKRYQKLRGIDLSRIEPDLLTRLTRATDFDIENVWTVLDAIDEPSGKVSVEDFERVIEGRKKVKP